MLIVKDIDCEILYQIKDIARLMRLSTLNTYFRDLFTLQFWNRLIKRDFLYVLDEDGSLKKVEKITGKTGISLYKELYKRKKLFDEFPDGKFLIDADIEQLKKSVLNPLIDPDYQNAMNAAVCFGNIEIVSMFLEDERVNPAANGNLAIMNAFRFGNYEICELLIRDGRVDPSVGDDWVLRWLIADDNFKLVHLLLQNPKVDPSRNYYDAVHRALNFNRREIAELLLKDPRIDKSKIDPVYLEKLKN